MVNSFSFSQFREENKENIFQIRGEVIADSILLKRNDGVGCLCTCIHGDTWREGDRYREFGGRACLACSNLATHSNELNRFYPDIYEKYVGKMREVA